MEPASVRPPDRPRAVTATGVAAAIIAGGRGRRLGGLDKSRLVIGGRRIIDRQLAVLGQVAPRVLVVTDDHHRFRASGLHACADVLPGAGPLGGLHTALTRSPGRRTLVVAGDLPFLSGAFLRHLASRAPHADAVVPRNAAGLQPLCAVYDRGCAEAIRARLETGRHRLVDLAGWLRVTGGGTRRGGRLRPRRHAAVQREHARRSGARRLVGGPPRRPGGAHAPGPP